MGDSTKQRYRYGLFLNPQSNDPFVEDLSKAERLAKEMSINNNGTPVAVWDDSNKTLRLFAGYEEFLPARL